MARWQRKIPKPKKIEQVYQEWIQLRAGAYRRGKYFSESVTPNYLKMINMGICPVTIREFTYASGTGDDWSVDRVDNDRGYERQNLVSMSTKANSAKSSLSYEEIADLVEHQDHVATTGLRRNQETFGPPYQLSSGQTGIIF